MVTMQCSKCGGQMKRVGNTNEAVCEFCGNRIFISAADENTRDKFKQMFKDFVKELDGSEAENKNRHMITEVPEQEEMKQEPADTYLVELAGNTGAKIQINALYQKELPACVMYVTRENVLFRFDSSHREEMNRYITFVKKIQYPTEVMQRNLHSYLPEELKQISLRDGEELLAIKKLQNTYPAGLLKPLQAEHVAWMVSRLENLACLLEYNGISIKDFTLDDIFIDPKNHQVLLYGGWWKAEHSMNMAPVLMANRKIGLEMAGIEHLPLAMKAFFHDRPSTSAREDFADWDTCLKRAFGKRVFIKLERTEKQIYEGRDNN